MLPDASDTGNEIAAEGRDRSNEELAHFVGGSYDPTD
jgi:hypothetical protein